MSKATYTVSVPTEIAERLKAVAKYQDKDVNTMLLQAITDYIDIWEEHIIDLSEDGNNDDRERLPWLNNCEAED